MEIFLDLRGFIMSKYKELELVIDKGKEQKLHYNEEYLESFKRDLDLFLNDDKIDINNMVFAKKMMMNQEIKANNNIEGIIDNLESIARVVKNNGCNVDEKERRRIINLYRGYKFILEGREINKDSLRELYSILSKDLLNEHDRTNMGKYYRKKPVYIIRKNRLDIEPYQGMAAKDLDYYMDMFFEYINSDNKDTDIDNYIKSQIMHYYFVYIHPYFDVNGRTSRTVSMWYLLNNNAYSYIIFNRAISFAKRKYEEAIINCRHRGDVTLFLKYMLIQVLKELEKDYLVSNISDNSGGNLTNELEQIIEYFINMNGNLTAKDLTKFYNYHNFKTKPRNIYKDKIEPLIDKKIFVVEGYTKSYIYDDVSNMWLKLNGDKIDIDKNKLKYLKIDKYIRR